MLLLDWLTKTPLKATAHLLIDHAGPHGDIYVWTKWTTALFKSLERLKQLAVHQALFHQRNYIWEWELLYFWADSTQTLKYIKNLKQVHHYYFDNFKNNKITMQSILHSYRRHQHYKQRSFQTFYLAGNIYYTVFLLNCQGMEPHLGLEFNGAFGAECALNKAVS